MTPAEKTFFAEMIAQGEKTRTFRATLLKVEQSSLPKLLRARPRDCADWLEHFYLRLMAIKLREHTRRQTARAIYGFAAMAVALAWLLFGTDLLFTAEEGAGGRWLLAGLAAALFANYAGPRFADLYRNCNAESRSTTAVAPGVLGAAARAYACRKLWPELKDARATPDALLHGCDSLERCARVCLEFFPVEAAELDRLADYAGPRDIDSRPWTWARHLFESARNEGTSGDELQEVLCYRKVLRAFEDMPIRSWKGA